MVDFNSFGLYGYPFRAEGNCDKLVPNAGSDSFDFGASAAGSTVLVVNSSDQVIHIAFGKDSAPTAAATDLPIGAGHAVTIARDSDERYIAAYCAGDASAGVYVQLGFGL